MPAKFSYCNQHLREHATIIEYTAGTMIQIVAHGDDCCHDCRRDNYIKIDVEITMKAYASTKV